MKQLKKLLNYKIRYKFGKNSILIVIYIQYNNNSEIIATGEKPVQSPSDNNKIQ